MKLHTLGAADLVVLNAEAVVAFAAADSVIDPDVVIRVRDLWQYDAAWCAETLGRSVAQDRRSVTPDGHPGNRGVNIVGLADMTGEELLLLDVAAQASFF